jgi:hypothetical protein
LVFQPRVPQCSSRSGSLTQDAHTRHGRDDLLAALIDIDSQPEAVDAEVLAGRRDDVYLATGKARFLLYVDAQDRFESSSRGIWNVCGVEDRAGVDFIDDKVQLLFCGKLGKSDDSLTGVDESRGVLYGWSRGTTLRQHARGRLVSHGHFALLTCGLQIIRALTVVPSFLALSRAVW